MSIVTKFGSVYINNKGYYKISGGKYQGKLLHRLIWEDFYNCEIPDDFVIHHKNKIKTDNCILNLQLMRGSEHKSLHKKGVKHSEETKRKISESHKGKKHTEKTRRRMSESQKGKIISEETQIKMSKSQNNTGYFRVHKLKDSHCKYGFIYRYQYYDDGNRKVITSVDIHKLEKKVKDKKLPWFNLNEE